MEVVRFELTALEYFESMRCEEKQIRSSKVSCSCLIEFSEAVTFMRSEMNFLRFSFTISPEFPSFNNDLTYFLVIKALSWKEEVNHHLKLQSTDLQITSFQWLLFAALLFSNSWETEMQLPGLFGPLLELIGMVENSSEHPDWLISFIIELLWRVIFESSLASSHTHSVPSNSI